MKCLVAADPSHTVALFGTGLIGSAIEQALCGGGWRSVYKPYSWPDEQARRDQWLRIVAELTGATAAGSSRTRSDIVWAAGVSGFGSTSEQMNQELALLTELCRAAQALREADPQREIVFHLVSSAGGLFEGQTQIGQDTVPSPLRPYGHGKLAGELLVQSLEPEIRTMIYRPASVYGFLPGGRRGLFATLVMNALTNRPTIISGAGRTLRDYILARDIGRFVAKKVGEQSDAAGRYLLASGKPTSMMEIIAAIESLVQRPLYRQFEPRASNALDLSFAPSALPPDLVCTPMMVGLARLEAQIRQQILRPTQSRM